MVQERILLLDLKAECIPPRLFWAFTTKNNTVFTTQNKTASILLCPQKYCCHKAHFSGIVLLHRHGGLILV